MTTAILALLLLTGMVFAALSQRLAMSVVTMPIVFTVAGFLASFAGKPMFAEDAQYEALHLIAEVTLVLVLFSDASQVRLKTLRKSIAIPARMLLIAMPLSILIGAVVAHWVSPDMPWAVAILVAAILAPTDAALGQAVISDPAIPERLREGIAVESGLNDGLALPVVIMAALAAVEASGAMAADQLDNLLAFGIAQVTLGPLAGIVVGAVSAWLIDFAVRRDLATESYRGIYFLCAAFLCFIAAELIGGNGLIAAFIGGLVFGNVRKNSSEFVAELMESEGQLLTMVTFIIFGAVLAPAGLEHASWKTVVLAIAFLTFVRMVPVALSLTGLGLRFRDKLFLGWFGPRGLASILFGLLVVESYPIPGIDEVLACVVLTVLISIAAHGASAFPITRAFGKNTSNSA